MKVLFYGNVIEYTNGDKSLEIEHCAGLRELINKLCDHYGDRLKDFILNDETCFFLVNGKGTMMTGGLNTKLQSDDKIEILPFAEAG
ncbi:MAG: MoaD/ThiS family protein [Treponema sp.]|nr:MoaD/ThiS family protein [Treponema sp.]